MSNTVALIGFAATQSENSAVSVEHYENFPVASLLCPPSMRPAVTAIYDFARTADDLADEGDASAEQRLADLADYRRDLTAVFTASPPSARWAPVFGALAQAVDTYGLPMSCLADLLSAFEQDVHNPTYQSRDDLLTYCARSANPVGRLLLHLYGVNDVASLRQSDAICSALQLANFWQDLGVDLRRGRDYLPQDDLLRHGLRRPELLLLSHRTALRSLVRDLVAWTETLMAEGMPLATRLPGRVGWELRLVAQGGLRILQKIEQQGFDSVARRPAVTAFDLPLLLWRGLRMRPAPPERIA